MKKNNSVKHVTVGSISNGKLNLNKIKKKIELKLNFVYVQNKPDFIR